MQKNWGIYTGFNPPTNPLNKWKEPLCSSCNHELEPWIDWWYDSSIGFCRKCNDLFIVKLTWGPAPGVHSRLEISELVDQEVHLLDLNSLGLNIENILLLHDSIPLETAATREVEQILNGLLKFNSSESKLLQHILWSLIFNSKEFDASLVKKYLAFIFKFPHYFNIYEKYDIWIGHEVDIAKRLDECCAEEVIKAIHEIWLNRDQNLNHLYFRSRFRFYVTTNDSDFEQFTDDFAEFAKNISW